MRRVAAAVFLGSLVGMAGCHSHYVQATITNTGSADVSVVQVDYPSASFGVQQLAPGAAFHYRFKLLGSGNIKLSYLDASKGEHAQTGPWLNEGQEGTLEIAIPASGHVTFTPNLRAK
jgi:hypothetical protein